MFFQFEESKFETSVLYLILCFEDKLFNPTVLPASSAVNVNTSFSVKFNTPTSSVTQPVGIPLSPIVHDEFTSFTNVPVFATPETQLYVQSVAVLSVAKHLI